MMGSSLGVDCLAKDAKDAKMYREIKTTVYSDGTGKVYHVSVEGFEREPEKAAQVLRSALEFVERKVAADRATLPRKRGVRKTDSK